MNLTRMTKDTMANPSRLARAWITTMKAVATDRTPLIMRRITISTKVLLVATKETMKPSSSEANTNLDQLSFHFVHRKLLPRSQQLGG
jgi:hypothetical protein